MKLEKNELKEDLNTLKKEGVKKPYFSFKNCCFGLIMVFVVIPALLVYVGVYLRNNEAKKDRQKIESRGKPESYSLLFSKYLPPNYSFTEKEQSQIDTLVSDAMEMSKPAGLKTSKEITQSGSKLDLEAKDKKSAAKELVTKLKAHYPEGYFVIAKSLILLSAEERYSFNLNFINNGSQTADTEVHEFSHSWSHMATGNYFVSGRNFNFTTHSGHLIEDKMIIYKNYYPLPLGNELVKYIPKLTSVDNTYLKDSKQDLYSTLDEINSYIKSTRVARVYNYYDNEDINNNSAAIVLSRQLFILSLQLKNLKEYYPEIWRAHAKNSSFAYVMMRLVEIANNELTAAKNEGLDSSKVDESFALTIDKNLELVGQNQLLFDEIYTTSGVDKFKGKDLSEAELKSLGITIEKIK